VKDRGHLSPGNPTLQSAVPTRLCESSPVDFTDFVPDLCVRDRAQAQRQFKKHRRVSAFAASQ